MSAPAATASARDGAEATALRNERRAARRDSLKGFGFALPALAWIVAFFVVPLAIMIAYSLMQRVGGQVVADLGLHNYVRFFTQDSLRGALFVSLEIALLTTVISVLLAYPLAWILAYRVPKRWQWLALILAILPFWTSYVVRSYSWLLVLAPTGIVNQTLMTLGITEAPIRMAYNMGATVLGFVHFFTMLVTLTIFASLVQINPRYHLAAADLGASRLRTFWHVTLPLSLPGVAVGAFLTFVISIGDYITPQILGGMRELSLPQAIMLQISRRGDFPMASAMALVLMVVVGLAYLAVARWLKIERL